MNYQKHKHGRVPLFCELAEKETMENEIARFERHCLDIRVKMAELEILKEARDMINRAIVMAGIREKEGAR